MAGVPPPEVSVAASRCAAGGPLALVCINDALPQELIGLVLRKLSDLIDFGRARRVCKTWHQLTSSPSSRQTSALWCVIQCGYYSELRIFDLFSGIEYKEVPVAHFRIKGQGGLIAIRSRYGGYWIGNPLLTKWAQVDMTGCGGIRSGGNWERGAWELVIARAQDGSSSYKLVQFMYFQDKHVHTVRLRVDIFDSRSRVWTAGSTLEYPPPLVAGQRNRLGLQSCVWSGRIYLLMSVTAEGAQFSILEFSVEKDTLTMMVPWAVLPMSQEEGKTLARHGVFQVQVREDYCEDGSSKVQLVVAEPLSAGNRWSPKPFQVFAWDHSLGRWVVKVQPEVAQSDDPDSNALRKPYGLRFWRDPWPEDQDLTSLGFLVRDRPETVYMYWPTEVPPELACSAVSVCRTDTLAEWYCAFRTTRHNKAYHGHGFFPNFHDQP